MKMTMKALKFKINRNEKFIYYIEDKRVLSMGKAYTSELLTYLGYGWVELKTFESEFDVRFYYRNRIFDINKSNLEVYTTSKADKICIERIKMTRPTIVLKSQEQNIDLVTDGDNPEIIFKEKDK